MKLSFSKLAAASNDFVLVDNRKGAIKNGAKSAQTLCHRKNGVGADGLILLEKSKTNDFRMRIFNPDGSEAEMCGNGVRCLARFAFDKKIAKAKQSIETLAGTILAEVKKDIVKARLSDPKDMKLEFDFRQNGKAEIVNFVNTGVPHVVKVLSSVEGVDAESAGREIRHHKYFQPRGTNVNFIALRSGNSISVRTYERGVEGETDACGTGSTASALVAAALKNLKSPVSVHTQGGEVLKVYFSRQGQNFKDVFLEGKVIHSFDGELDLK